MKVMIINIYEFATIIIPFLIAYIIIGKKYRNNSVKDKKKDFFLFMFSIYMFFVFYLTGSGTVYELNRYGIETSFNKINLLPFSRDIDVIGYVQNVFLFIPFGFFMPLIWPDINKFWRVVIRGFSFSLLIETSQLFNIRSTDIDDLILNTFGAIIGYLLFKVLAHIFKLDNVRTTRYKYEPTIYVTVMFLGHFLFFNEFGLARRIYNF